MKLLKAYQAVTESHRNYHYHKIEKDWLYADNIRPRMHFVGLFDQVPVLVYIEHIEDNFYMFNITNLNGPYPVNTNVISMRYKLYSHPNNALFSEHMPIEEYTLLFAGLDHFIGEFRYCEEATEAFHAMFDAYPRSLQNKDISLRHIAHENDKVLNDRDLKDAPAHGYPIYFIDGTQGVLALKNPFGLFSLDHSSPLYVAHRSIKNNLKDFILIDQENSFCKWLALVSGGLN